MVFGGHLKMVGLLTDRRRVSYTAKREEACRQEMRRQEMHPAQLTDGKAPSIWSPIA